MAPKVRIHTYVLRRQKDPLPIYRSIIRVFLCLRCLVITRTRTPHLDPRLLLLLPLFSLKESHINNPASTEQKFVVQRFVFVFVEASLIISLVKESGKEQL